MAYIYSEGNSLAWSDTTPAKTVAAIADIDLAGTTDYLAVNVQVSVTWGASGDGNATVEFFTSSDGGITVDSIPFYSAEMGYNTGNTERQSFQFHQIPWLRVSVINGNTAVQDITVSGKWSGLYME